MLVYPVDVGGQPIPYDPTLYDSIVNVAAGGTVARAAVVFDVLHPYAGDVDVYLTPPGGGALDACTGNGDLGDNFTDTLLDSTCATPIANVTNLDAPFSACYSPETSFAPLIGTAANGSWTLSVSDNYPSLDDGTLEKWRLILCTTP